VRGREDAGALVEKHAHAASPAAERRVGIGVGDREVRLAVTIEVGNHDRFRVGPGRVVDRWRKATVTPAHEHAHVRAFRIGQRQIDEAVAVQITGDHRERTTAVHDGLGRARETQAADRRLTRTAASRSARASLAVYAAAPGNPDAASTTGSASAAPASCRACISNSERPTLRRVASAADRPALTGNGGGHFTADTSARDRGVMLNAAGRRQSGQNHDRQAA
jgi:hypothetical protein